MQTPQTVEELAGAIGSMERVIVQGGGSKTALSANANISTAALTGIVEYDPSEFTFTAQAGTTIAEIRDRLAAHGQYLPFDPVLVEAGATLGGTIASGLSGPGRVRYGGVRDFLLGMKFITGNGEMRAGGGKVVKNAAGFDFPKLMVGARGEFGIITEATFKVFPEPRQFATIIAQVEGTDSALKLMNKLANSTLELACLDYAPPQLEIRVGGLHDSLPKRVANLRVALGCPSTTLTGEEDRAHWSQVREFHWVSPGTTLIKVPIAPTKLSEVERFVSQIPNIFRRYTVGGHLAWMGWPDELGPDLLVEKLRRSNLKGLAVLGQPWGLLGTFPTRVFGDRLARVLDSPGSLRQENPYASFASP